MSSVGLFNAFINLEPVQRSEDECDMSKCRSFNHSECKPVLNLLKAIYFYLRLRKIVVQIVIVVKLGVGNIRKVKRHGRHVGQSPCRDV